MFELGHFRPVDEPPSAFGATPPFDLNRFSTTAIQICEIFITQRRGNCAINLTNVMTAFNTRLFTGKVRSLTCVYTLYYSAICRLTQDYCLIFDKRSAG